MNFIKKIKTLTVILLFALIVFHLNGQFIVFKIFEYKIKKEIKTRIKMGVPEDELVLLKIPKSLEENPGEEFRRIHEKEFRFKGEMYDIVRKTDNGDTTNYYCIHDEEETKLFANLHKLIKNEFNDPEKKKELNSFISLLSYLYLESNSDLIHKVCYTERLFIFPIFETISIIIHPLLTPPKSTV